jgi:hypothetical protein
LDVAEIGGDPVKEGLMKEAARWSRILVIVGLAAMVIGALDPLEGSLVILPGTALAALGAYFGTRPHRRLSYWSLALVAFGVGVMWWVSALGGFGGATGRSMWWALVLLPYPVGWLLGLAGAVRGLRAGNRRSVPSAAH